MKYRFGASIWVVIVGAVCPLLIDFSKTTELHIWTTDGIGRTLTTRAAVYPYSIMSMLCFDHLLGFLICCALIGKSGIRNACFIASGASKELDFVVWPGILYTLSDMLSLLSVNYGNGSLVVIIGQSRTVMVAVLSAASVGGWYTLTSERMIILGSIALSAAGFTLAEHAVETSRGSPESILNFGIFLCVVRAVVSAGAAVSLERALCKSKLSMFQVAFLVKGVNLSASIILVLAPSDLRPSLCASEDFSECFYGSLPQCECQLSKEWDYWSILALTCWITNGFTSLLIFKSLGATAKYVAQSLAGPAIFSLGVALGQREFESQAGCFVGLLGLMVVLYSRMYPKEKEGSDLLESPRPPPSSCLSKDLSSPEEERRSVDSAERVGSVQSYERKMHAHV